LGCWNENIYGGDASLEWKENMYELCKAKEYDSKNKPKAIPLGKLKSKLDDLIEMIEKSDTDDGDKNIGYVVLGSIMMHSGFDFDTEIELKERIISAAERDEWSNENPLRKIVMRNYIRLINDYNPSEPINVDSVNFLEDTTPTEEEDIANEFKELFTIMNARIKKLERGMEEKSGNKDYDEGFADASQEEVDFLTDFKELISRQEQLGIILERISKGLDIGYGGENKAVANTSIKESASGAGKDSMPG